jgi:hypothetical protein
MGIVDTPAAQISPNDLKGSGSAKALINDRVELSFVKQRQQAVRWQMRRGDVLDWGFDRDGVTSPLIDPTASIDGKPEKREYRCIILKNNEPIGQYSDIITVITTP